MHFEITPKLPFLLGCSGMDKTQFLASAELSWRPRGRAGAVLPQALPTSHKDLIKNQVVTVPVARCAVILLTATWQFWASQCSAETSAWASSRMPWHHKPQAMDILELAVWTPSINHVWARRCLRIQQHGHTWIEQVLLPSWASLGKLPCPHKQNPCSNAAFSHWALLSKPS